MVQGFGRHPRSGMQIFVKTFKTRCPLKKVMTLGGIPAKKDHKAPGKSLARDDNERHGKTLAGVPARPLPRTPVGPPSGPHRSHLHRRSHAAANPTNWAGTCVAAHSLFVKTHRCATSAACLPTWHHEHSWPGRVSTLEGA